MDEGASERTIRVLLIFMYKSSAQRLNRSTCLHVRLFRHCARQAKTSAAVSCEARFCLRIAESCAAARAIRTYTIIPLFLPLHLNTDTGFKINLIAIRQNIDIFNIGNDLVIVKNLDGTRSYAGLGSFKEICIIITGR